MNFMLPLPEMEKSGCCIRVLRGYNSAYTLLLIRWSLKVSSSKMGCRMYLFKLRRVAHFKVECRICHFYFKVNDCSYDMIWYAFQSTVLKLERNLLAMHFYFFKQYWRNHVIWSRDWNWDWVVLKSGSWTLSLYQHANEGIITKNNFIHSTCKKCSLILEFKFLWHPLFQNYLK